MSKLWRLSYYSMHKNISFHQKVIDDSCYISHWERNDDLLFSHKYNNNVNEPLCSLHGMMHHALWS